MVPNSLIVDAEKTFGCVEWRYLLQLLEILGFRLNSCLVVMPKGTLSIFQRLRGMTVISALTLYTRES